MLTIVTYHYVRDPHPLLCPGIRGLRPQEFEAQVRYIKEHYNVISGHDLLRAVRDGLPLPPRSLLLTFDDGYVDHFTCVLPVLRREGLRACFFPPAQCIVEDVVLDVNKIHFVLATARDTAPLLNHLFDAIHEHGRSYDLPEPAVLWQRFGRPGRYDGPEVAFFKRMLQRDLPAELRRTITAELFRQYVTLDEASFARDLYMNREQLACLCEHGMYIGCHGYTHAWLDSLGPDEQASEIDAALDLLASMGTDFGNWIMSYPYGGYDDSLLRIVAARGCAAGLTTHVGLASLERNDPLRLPRIDTNDLPKASSAAVSEWTLKVQDKPLGTRSRVKRVGDSPWEDFP